MGQRLPWGKWTDNGERGEAPGERMRMREDRHDGVQDREAAEIKGEHSRAKD